MASFTVICNRVGDYAACDDLDNAKHIVCALMAGRPASSGDWFDYWVRDEHGNEWTFDAHYYDCFISAGPMFVRAVLVEEAGQ